MDVRIFSRNDRLRSSLLKQNNGNSANTPAQRVNTWVPATSGRKACDEPCSISRERKDLRPDTLRFKLTAQLFQPSIQLSPLLSSIVQWYKDHGSLRPESSGNFGQIVERL